MLHVAHLGPILVYYWSSWHSWAHSTPSSLKEWRIRIRIFNGTIQKFVGDCWENLKETERYFNIQYRAAISTWKDFNWLFGILHQWEDKHALLLALLKNLMTGNLYHKFITFQHKWKHIICFLLLMAQSTSWYETVERIWMRLRDILIFNIELRFQREKIYKSWFFSSIDFLASCISEKANMLCYWLFKIFMTGNIYHKYIAYQHFITWLHHKNWFDISSHITHFQTTYMGPFWTISNHLKSSQTISVSWGLKLQKATLKVRQTQLLPPKLLPIDTFLFSTKPIKTCECDDRESQSICRFATITRIKGGKVETWFFFPKGGGGFALPKPTLTVLWPQWWWHNTGSSCKKKIVHIHKPTIDM